MSTSEDQAEHLAKPADEQFREPLHNLIADGKRRIDRVDEALEKIALQYRGRTEDRSYRQFIAALKLANQAARQFLISTERSGEKLPKQAYDAARSLMKGFASKHEKQVEALRPARAEALEVFAQPFTRLAKKLLPNAEVLFFGWRLESYQLRVYDRYRARELTGGAPVSIQREFGEDFQFVQFLHPVLRQVDLFQHAVFGHELAHPMIRRKPPAEVVKALGANSRSPNYANIAVDTAHSEMKKNGIFHSTEEQQRLTNWFDEIACDTIGMRLLGPAFGIAFVEVTSVNWYFERDDKSDSKRYPPIAMRMNFMAEELERFQLSSPYEERLRPSLDRLMKSTVQTGGANDEIPAASEWMNVAVAAFRDHCVGPLLGKEALCPATLSENFSDIWLLIDRGIPPAEKITVTHEDPPTDHSMELTPWSVEYDWRLILNVARIGLLDPHLNADNGWQLSRAKAARLATGAIEMAEFHRRARILRKQYSRVGPLDGP